MSYKPLWSVVIMCKIKFIELLCNRSRPRCGVEFVLLETEVNSAQISVVKFTDVIRKR